MFEQLRQFLRDNPRLPLIVAIAGLTCVLVIWGVWGGFALDFSRFYAAEPTGACNWQNPDERGLPECACNTANRQNLCHVCTSSWKGGNIDYSDGQWAAWDGEGLCRPSCPDSRFPYLTGRTKSDGTAFSLPQGCVEKPDDCPDGYHALTVGGGVTICEVDATAPDPDPIPTAVSTAPPLSSTCVTPAPGSHTASTLFVQCGTAQNVLIWTLPSGNDSNTILKSIDGADGFAVSPGPACSATTFTDTAVQPGHTYTYRHKAFADQTSNMVTCPTPVTVLAPTPTQSVAPTATFATTPTPTATATLTPTPVATPPTPTPEPTQTPMAQAAPGLVCTPQSQTVIFGQIGYFQAFGGDGTYYAWDGGPAAIQEDDEGFATAAFSWTVYGTKVVTVRSAGESATCVVEVVDPNATPSPTPAPTGPIAVTKQARNQTAGQTAPREAVNVSTNQRIEFTIRVTDREGDGTFDVFVRDTLPPGMSYLPGTTTIDGRSTGDGIVTGPLSIGSLPPRGERTVRWSALADRFGELPVGAQTVRPEAMAETTEDGESFVRADGVTLTLFGTGTGSDGPFGGAGVPATGPGGATLLALVLAAVSSLLYAAYTRSPGFRRRELRYLGEDQGPMDFRN